MQIAYWIHDALQFHENEAELNRIRAEVVALTTQYPVRGER